MTLRLPWRGSPAAGPAVDRRASLAAALALVALSSAWAADGGLTIADPWMRMIVASRPAAGYFVLVNDSDRDLALVGAASPGCGTLMLHESLHEGGQDRMVMVKRVPVAAHGRIAFQPGGFHLMCISPKPSVTPGGSVPVTLRFDDGSTIAAIFPVRGATGK